ncbi:Serine proteinase stubble [Eufriesea mexicana]|uniref:Phenoloxidase-activating factor 2 n=1 Tax=Eufriesea mexicana TaxID=516756 RepID=A0A310SNS9_9HYME|nr:PREDICTED: proclotting enzyme-like [Eufriesea mexicana]OAD59342.1 Serine proteinase stubble [Eufriesea mexicana]
MDRRRRASSLTTLVLLVLQTAVTIFAVCGTIHADPEGKTAIFESSVEEVHRGENDDNAVIIDATSDTDARLDTRDGRGILWNGVSDSESCLTSKGEIGRCTSFKECYPYFKIPDLSALDGWVLGVYDTCSYTRENGQTNFGICCSNILPVVTPPSDNTEDPTIDNTQEGNSTKEEETTVKPRPQTPGSWPPPIPTHPPDHTIPPLPTHPPYLELPTFSTIKPVFTSKKPAVATTWPTKKPAWWPGAPAVPTTSEKPLGTISSIDTSQCGAKNGVQDQERIVGGQNADPGEWPWIAALFNGGRQFCGGSLIDDKHVLTAAHCVANMNSWDVARLTVRLGDYNIKTNLEVRHIERRVKRVVRHRGFNSRTLYNDIALLTLNEPVPFTKQIRPICLPSGSQLYSGKIATVIGWGSLRESGPQPAILQEVSIPIWSNSECKSKYGAAAPGGIVDSFLCAGRAAKDSCSGDSGGPLMVNDGRWTQVGIVSWGIGCGKGQYPGVYTRVTHFLPWISKNLMK